MKEAVMRTKLYVGCSLTQASEDFRANVERLKEALRQRGYDVFDFVGLVNGTPRDVYEWDIQHCVGEADMVIGICDLPSIGLGWELSTAVNLRKLTLAVAHTDAHVTRMLVGAAMTEPNMRFERYIDLVLEVPDLVERILVDSGTKT